MKVRLLLFSVLRDLAGGSEFDLELPANARVADLLAAAFARWPSLAAWDASLLIAVDQTYARRDAALREGAEVALMPPVQGG